MLPAATGIAIVTLFIAFWQKHHSFTIIDLLVWLAICCCLLLILLNTEQYNLHQEAFCNLVAFLCLFLVLRHIENDLIQKIIIPAILCFFVLELYIGYRDFFQNLSSPGLFLLIKGHLHNSGVYAIYLVLHLPLVRFFLLQYTGKKWCFPLLIFVFAAVVFLVIITTSRAAILGAISYVIILVFRIELFKAYRKPLLMLFTLPFIGLIIGLLYLKPASAFGRFLIWKITLLRLPEYKWTGVGYGEFSRHYPSWQINYFEHLPAGSLDEMLSADEVFAAYNEPLQLMVELGIFGTLVISIIFALYLFKRPKKNDHLLEAIRSLLVLLFITSLFSYPIHVNAISIIVVVCMTYATPLLFQRLIFRGSIAVYIIALILLFPITIKSITMYKTQYKWHLIQDNVFLPEEERLTVYRELYKDLKYNSKFLLDYGSLLYTVQDTSNIKILEECKAQLITVNVLALLARTCEDEGSLNKAISTQQDLSNYIPFKFSYKDQLIDMYLKNKDTTNANRIANLILNMPVKKNDSKVQSIKKRALQILNL